MKELSEEIARGPFNGPTLATAMKSQRMHFCIRSHSILHSRRNAKSRPCFCSPLGIPFKDLPVELI